MTIPNYQEKDLYIEGRFPLFANMDAGNPRKEYFDYDSFANLTDPGLVCLWSHKKDQEIAAVSRGTMKLWLAKGNLNVLILFEEDNPVSRDVFLDKMVNYPYIGLSPRYSHDPTKEPVDADGSKKQIGKLIEMSLTTHPVHRGSVVILHSPLNMDKVSAWVRKQKDWIKDPGSRREADKFVSALPNTSTRIMTPEEVEEFKRGLPYFKRVSERGGYETGAINPYK